jgi:AraC-like DNA-binding protein
MALTRETVHSSSALRIDLVRCRPHDDACGQIEYSPRHSVAFPLRGVFVRHYGRHESVVADSCQAQVFDPRVPYRVSHPIAGGDDCLSIEPSAELLRQIPLPARPAPLRTRAIAAPQLLIRRIRCGLAGPLEAEETALDLLCEVAALPSLAAEPASQNRRHAEMVEATRLTLAAQPAEAWGLSELARRVHTSPFHLARVFRRLAGSPLHRCLLHARLAAALRELLDSQRDLSTIGVGLGFSSHSHFSAAFRSAFGVTPSALRKRARI